MTIVNGAIKSGDLIADVLGPDALAQDSEWAYMISFLPGLKSAGGTEEILRNTIGERVLGLPTEPRLDKGIPFSELRARRRQGMNLASEAGSSRHGPLPPSPRKAAMNLALSDEQVLLREAARGALSRFKTLEEAREALDSGGSPADLWPTAKEAGWPGLLIDEAHGGAGLDVFDAMLVLGECGRALAAVPLLGHLPATAILNDGAGGLGKTPLLEELASGERRAAYLAARPPDDISEQWSVDPASGMERPALPSAVRGGDGEARVSGQIRVRARRPRRRRAGGRRAARRPRGRLRGGVLRGRRRVDPVRRYDATRALGHVALEDAPATILDASEGSLAEAWHLAQALIAAESLGAVESALDVSVAYAKERFTFGRAIGSYQAVKHSLTEVLRQLENGRSLLYYAGLVAPRSARGVPAGGQRRALGGGPRARPRRAHDDLGARRHRRHLGARRPAVLPPRPALPAPVGRHRARHRPGGVRADRAGVSRYRRRARCVCPVPAAVAVVYVAITGAP